MSKQKNQYLLLQTLKKMYKGTCIEELVKDAKCVQEINPLDIEESKLNYYLTDKLVKFYIKETMKEEKVSNLYQFCNSWQIRCNLCTNYLAGNTVEDLEKIEIFPFDKRKNPAITRLQLDSCKI